MCILSSKHIYKFAYFFWYYIKKKILNNVKKHQKMSINYYWNDKFYKKKALKFGLSELKKYIEIKKKNL